MYQLKPMEPADAREIATWVYPDVYAIYSFQPDDETIRELLDGTYAACLEDSLLAGYFCYGQSAQIPTLEADVYPHGWVDLGLGLKPSLCGRGQGAAFMRAGMQEANKRFPGMPLRLTVACFNQRAIHLYEKMGFVKQQQVTHRHSKQPFAVMCCTRYITT